MATNRYPGTYEACGGRVPAKGGTLRRIGRGVWLPELDQEAEVLMARKRRKNVRLVDKPLAARGLISYRYRGRYGWIMIGAKDHEDALREAARSTDGPITMDKLEAWDAASGTYVPATVAED